MVSSAPSAASPGIERDFADSGGRQACAMVLHNMRLDAVVLFAAGSACR
jgi:hypothetical protein